MACTCTRVQLFYDVISPFSWLGFELLQRYSRKWNIKLDLCPFFLAGIMKGSMNRPPGVVPSKARYLGTDLKRIRDYYKVPLKVPANPAEVMFSKGSLEAQRLLTAVKLYCPDYLVSLSRQLWLRVWSRDEDITTVESLTEASEKAGIPKEIITNLVAHITAEEIKEELKRTTQQALDTGAFGAPWIIAHVGDNMECFFGSDRMELLAVTLGEKYEGPLIELQASL